MPLPGMPGGMSGNPVEAVPTLSVLSGSVRTCSACEASLLDSGRVNARSNEAGVPSVPHWKRIAERVPCSVVRALRLHLVSVDSDALPWYDRAKIELPCANSAYLIENRSSGQGSRCALVASIVGRRPSTVKTWQALCSAFLSDDVQPRVAVLKGHPEFSQAARAARTEAFASNGSPPKHLLEAIRAVSSRANAFIF